MKLWGFWCPHVILVGNDVIISLIARRKYKYHILLSIFLLYNGRCATQSAVGDPQTSRRVSEE